MAGAPRTGLVLGGGGIVGGAWLVGALAAIAGETGWNPASADYVVGTSAGAMVGALLASGVPPWRMVERSLVEGSGPTSNSQPRHFGTVFKPAWSFPRPVMGSPGLALRSLREPWRYGPAGIVAWLPQGVISTEPLKDAVRQVVPEGWSPHPNLWIMATDYRTGERVAFGRAGAPPADLADAVAASCAIPGFFHPVTIGGHRYVDGGVLSASNLDVLYDSDVELVICLNPMSSAYRGRGISPAGRIASIVRGNIGDRLQHEARRLQAAGKRVMLIQPTVEDLRVMGFNYMSGKHSNEVIQTSIATTTTAIRSTELGAVLQELPQGDEALVRRPIAAALAV